MPTREEWDDADDLVEDLKGIIPRGPQQGIADMTRRIERYQALHDQVKAEHHTPRQEERLLSFERQITEWTQRRKEYETMLKGRN